MCSRPAFDGRAGRVRIAHGVPGRTLRRNDVRRTEGHPRRLPGTAALQDRRLDRRRGAGDGGGRGACCEAVKRTERELTAIGIDSHQIVTQKGVAQDAVDAGPGVVQDDRHFPEHGVADLERANHRRRSARAPADRLQFDRLAPRHRRQPCGRGQHRTHDHDAGTGVEQEPTTVSIDERRHDPDSEPGFERNENLAVSAGRLQSRQAVNGFTGGAGMGIEEQRQLEGVGGGGAQTHRRQCLTATVVQLGIAGLQAYRLAP